MLAAVLAEQLVDEKVPALDHRSLGRVLAGVPPPDQHLVDLGAFLARRRHRLVGLDLVVDQLAAAVVAVHRHQHAAARVGDPVAAGVAAEPAEHLGVDHPEPGAGEHRHGQFGDHRQVEGNPVTGPEAAEVAQQRGEFVHPAVQLLIGDRHRVH